MATAGRRPAAAPSAAVCRALVASRGSGVLQLSGRDLPSLPPQVFDPDAELPGEEGAGASWWEVVELTKLVASHNQLTELPPEVANLSTLTTLDLGHNQLRELPVALCELEQLKVLDVTGNALVALPEELAGVGSLVRLLAGGNALAALPEGLGAQQPALAEVAAPGNAISALPAGLARAGALVRLALAGNKIAELGGPALAGMTALTELDLRGNALQVLDDAVGSLRALRVLEVRENRLATLPPALGRCGALVELHAGHNALAALPPALADCASLALLDVRRNALTALPPELCALRLSLLDLTDNNLSALPPQLGLMTSLRKLPLDGNPLKSIRRELLHGPTPRLLDWLRDKIPDDYGAVGQQRDDQARSGNMFGGDSAALAAEAADKLRLGGNQRQALSFPGAGLTDIPAEVWEAGAGGLQSLDVSNNKVAAIDAAQLSGCRDLSALQLSRNRLAAWPLPAEPGAMPALRSLSMAFNPIRSAPPGAFASCAATLRVLDMSGVPAAGGLPPGALASLRQLEELVVCQASLAAFPCEVIDPPLGCACACSTCRGIRSRRLRSIRRPCWSVATKAVLEYLRDRIPA
eukprot:jgi/Tetstr1/433635/TSEL_000006.t1